MGTPFYNDFATLLRSWGCSEAEADDAWVEVAQEIRKLVTDENTA